MAKLRKAIVEFDKNKKSGKVCIKFLTELAERQDRLALIAKFKEDVEPVLTEDGFSWSNLFKVTEVSYCSSGHKWVYFSLALLRVNKPPEWSEKLYEACIAYQVRQLCHFVEDDVDFIEGQLCHFVEDDVDFIEEDLLHEKLPEVSRTFWFDED